MDSLILKYRSGEEMNDGRELSSRVAMTSNSLDDIRDCLFQSKSSVFDENGALNEVGSNRLGSSLSRTEEWKSIFDIRREGSFRRPWPPKMFPSAFARHPRRTGLGVDFLLRARISKYRHTLARFVSLQWLIAERRDSGFSALLPSRC